MLLKILDILACPKCGDASRLWKLQGELTDTRITNGSVICKNDHQWNVTEEILRFDEEKSQGEMEFLDHPRTGLPSRTEVHEQERISFLTSLEERLETLPIKDIDIVKVTGDPILFLKYLPTSNANFIIVHPSEGILRQIQEAAVRKRMYDNMAFVKAEDVDYIGKLFDIGIFDEQLGKNKIIFKESSEGELIWKGEKTSLFYEFE